MNKSGGSGNSSDSLQRPRVWGISTGGLKRWLDTLGVINRPKGRVRGLPSTTARVMIRAPPPPAAPPKMQTPTVERPLHEDEIRRIAKEVFKIIRVHDQSTAAGHAEPNPNHSAPVDEDDQQDLDLGLTDP